MGKFEITTPEGKKYEIEAPDAESANASLEEFLAGQGNSSPSAGNSGDWESPGILAPIQFKRGPEGGAATDARLAMPQILTDAWNAIQAPGKALQGNYDELAIDPASGQVAPFDTRMMDDAANLASMVSPISVPSRIAMPAAKAATRAALPEIDDLYAAKAAAYGNVDKLGARYSGEAIDGLYGDMIRRASHSNISETRHPKAYSLLVELQQNPRPMTLTELDQLRQVVRRDLIGADAAEAHFGREFIDSIDDFIDNAGPGQISGVTGQTASWAINTARKANTVLRKSETLQDALEAARLRAASSGSGGNIDNAIRQELRKIVLSPKKSMGFTKAELAQMEAIIVGGGKLQDALRLVGKLSPSGNGLMAALGIGGTMANPAAAAIPALGLAAKSISDRATKAGVENLTSTVRNGATPLPVPRIGSTLTPRANTTLLEQNFGARLLPAAPVKFRLEA